MEKSNLSRPLRWWTLMESLSSALVCIQLSGVTPRKPTPLGGACTPTFDPNENKSWWFIVLFKCWDFIFCCLAAYFSHGFDNFPSSSNTLRWQTQSRCFCRTVILQLKPFDIPWDAFCFLLFWGGTLVVECTYCKSLWIKASAKWNVM